MSTTIDQNLQEYVKITLDDQLVPYALLAIVATLLHYLIISFMGGKHRRSHFSLDFMKKHFEDDFKKVQSPLKEGGYPDCGNGLHSRKLNYG